MSVTIMAAVFAANMPELKTDEGKTVPDSTAKFVLLSLADHASEDGENAYIGVKRICQKTNFSTSTVCNALNALRTSGIIELVGKSKAETNNYTINVSRLQSLKFQPVESGDSSRQNPVILAAEVKPSVNHQNNQSEDSSKNTAYMRGEQERPDKVAALLEMANFPGAKIQARIDSILSYLGGALQRNTETKEWKEFAKYVDSEKQTKGWDVSVFVAWMRSQKGYDPAYWSCRRMREFYPMAFTQNNDEEPLRML